MTQPDARQTIKQKFLFNLADELDMAVEEDNYGQLVIYTDLELDDDDNLVQFTNPDQQ